MLPSSLYFYIPRDVKKTPNSAYQSSLNDQKINNTETQLPADSEGHRTLQETARKPSTHENAPGMAAFHFSCSFLYLLYSPAHKKDRKKRKKRENFLGPPLAGTMPSGESWRKTSILTSSPSSWLVVVTGRSLRKRLLDRCSSFHGAPQL